MTETLRPARLPPPGTILKRELEARGWTQKDLAAIIQRPEQAISEIANGEKRITAETAIALAGALGTSAEFWLNLQSNFDLWQAQRSLHSARLDPIRRKAKIYERAPVAELIRRRWIKKAQSLDVLEQEVLRFLGIKSLEERSDIAATLRQSEAFTPEAAAQTAWLSRVNAVAQRKGELQFSRAKLKDALDGLLHLSRDLDSVSDAISWLAEHGVAVAIVKPLPRTFIDGAAFVREDGTPVVALSLRYDRIDAFWFTLLHELGHLVLGHRGTYLDNLSVDEELPPQEREANAFAEELLIPKARFDAWLKAHRHIGRADLLTFAEELGRHPGIVAGQLHHRGRVPFSRFRDLLKPVSGKLASWISP